MRIRLEDVHDILEGLERMRPDQKIAISALKRPISHAAYALAAINIIAKYGIPLHLLIVRQAGFTPAKFLFLQEKSRSEERHFRATREEV